MATVFMFTSLVYFLLV